MTPAAVFLNFSLFRFFLTLQKCYIHHLSKYLIRRFEIENFIKRSELRCPLVVKSQTFPKNSCFVNNILFFHFTLCMCWTSKLYKMCLRCERQFKTNIWKTNHTFEVFFKHNVEGGQSASDPLKLYEIGYVKFDYKHFYYVR